MAAVQEAYGDHAMEKRSRPRGLKLHVQSLHLAHAATAVECNGRAASFGRLRSGQQSSYPERLRFIRVRLNILQSESETRANGCIGIIRISRRQQFGGANGLFEHVVVNNFAGGVRAAPCGISHLIPKFEGNVEFNGAVPNRVADRTTARTGDPSVCIRFSDKCFVHLQGPRERMPERRDRNRTVSRLSVRTYGLPEGRLL